MEQNSTQRIGDNHEHSGGIQGGTHCPLFPSILSFMFCRQWIRLHFCNKRAKECGTTFCKAAGKRIQTPLHGAEKVLINGSVGTFHFSFSILMFADLKKYQFYYW